MWLACRCRWLDDARVPVPPAAAILLLASLTQLVPCPAQEPLRQFRNANASFHIDLPADWRVLSPNEALQLRSDARAPSRLGLSQPRSFYAVGPVARWLAGDFTTAWLYVAEQENEWHVEDDFAAKLAELWQQESRTSGDRHELTGVQRTKVGAQQVEAIVAIRTTTSAAGRPALTSLDVHAPAGGTQVSLSFTCPPDQFARQEPEFRRWLATLTFARVSRQQESMGDRLWTPIVTGAVVGLALLLLYKHTRGRR